MQIKVKTLTGKEVSLNVEETDTIRKVKERLEEKEGIYPDQQRLIFGGRAMADTKTYADLFFSVLTRRSIADYQLKAGDTIHLVLAL